MKVPCKLILDDLDFTSKKITWDSNRLKIKHSTSTAHYSGGGYKSVDVKSKLISLKLTWIKKTVDDKFYVETFGQNFSSPLGGAFLFDSNLRLSDSSGFSLVEEGGGGGWRDQRDPPVTILSPSITTLSPHKNFQKTTGKTIDYCN